MSGIEVIREKICILEISSFAGYSIGAEHFYGTLICGNKRIELKRMLSRKEAKYLNDKNGVYGAYKLSWRAGDMVNMFNEKESIVRVAIKEYKQHFPDAVVLLRGTPACVDPQEILDAPKFFVDAGTKLVEQAKSFGGWDNEKKMNRVCEAWERLLLKL